VFQKAVSTQGKSFKHTKHKFSLIGYLTIQLMKGKIPKSIYVMTFRPNPRKCSTFIYKNQRHAEYLNNYAWNKTVPYFVQCAISTAISLVTADWCLHQIRKSTPKRSKNGWMEQPKAMEYGSWRSSPDVLYTYIYNSNE
jgi:hypothetical protein